MYTVEVYRLIRLYWEQGEGCWTPFSWQHFLKSLESQNFFTFNVYLFYLFFAWPSYEFSFVKNLWKNFKWTFFWNVKMCIFFVPRYGVPSPWYKVDIIKKLRKGETQFWWLRHKMRCWQFLTDFAHLTIFVI